MEEIHNLITGCFVEHQIYRNDVDSEEEEEDGGDEDIGWLGYKEVSDMNHGKSFVSYERPKLKTGELIHPGSRKVQRCRGPIVLYKQWWQVTFLRTKTSRDNYKEPKDRYAICYRLRNDAKCCSDQLVGLFISDILNDRMTGNPTLIDTRGKFERYLMEHSFDKDTDLYNLKERLEGFSEQYKNPDPEVESWPEEQFMMAILHSGQYIQAELGKSHPMLLHYLPQLFPFHFIKILTLKEDVLDGLVECIEEEPGNLAFKPVLAKRYHVLGVETNKEALIQSGLMSRVPKKEQDAIEIYEFLKKETKDYGHTWVTFDKIMTSLSKEVSMWEEAMEFLNKHKITKTQMEAGHRIVYLQQLWKAENQIAKGLNSLIKKQELQPWNLKVDLSGEDFATIMSDNDQGRAARLIASEPVCAISGKGGCGKTYVVTNVLKAATADRSMNIYGVKDKEKYNKLDDDMTQDPDQDDKEKEDKCPEDINILLTAPTGKAANLLGKRAGLSSCTLHQVIWSYRMLKPGLDWKHKDVNVLVVDECSLVSVSTMAFLLEVLLKHSKLKRVVLLGDIRQLPSIEPGNFLKDTFQSLEVIGLSVELRTNHRSESQAIVDNATRISNKMYPVFDNEKFIVRRLPEENPESSGNDYMLQDINDNIIKLLSHTSLKCHVNSQFISFTRKVCEAVNDLCCKHYSKHRIKENKKFVFRVGDKICCTKNGYVNLYNEKHGLMSCTKDANEPEKEAAGGVDRTILTGAVNDTMLEGDTTLNLEENNKPKSKQIRLCNGEIFFIMSETERESEQNKMTTFYELSEDGKKENTFWVDKRQLRRACKIRHAWARTIHTFQGSETDHVVYIVGSRSWRQNWQHVYTAVTRGRKTVFIVGQESILRAAVRRSEVRRQTGLKKQILQAFQKDKKLPANHEVDSSILCPVSQPGQNNLTKAAQWLAGCPRMPASMNQYVRPSTSTAGVNRRTELNDTQVMTGILSSLASEHDQEDSDGTCSPDNISDRDSPSLLAPPPQQQQQPSTSNGFTAVNEEESEAMPDSDSQSLLAPSASRCSKGGLDSEDTIDEFTSDDDGPVKGLVIKRGVAHDDNVDDSDADSDNSESLLSQPASRPSFTKLKSSPPSLHTTKSGHSVTNGELSRGTINAVKCKSLQDGVSPIQTGGSRRESNGCYIRTGLSPLTPSDPPGDWRTGTNRLSPFTPVSGHSGTSHVVHKTSSPFGNLCDTGAVNHFSDQTCRPGLLGGPSPAGRLTDIQEPLSNESMWSEIDESDYLNISESQLTVNKARTSEGGSFYPRLSLPRHPGRDSVTNSANKHVYGESPFFSTHGNKSMIKTPNINNQSSCSQWSEVDDDQQYITALDLADIEHMATQQNHNTDITPAGKSLPFSNYRQTFTTPPDVDNQDEIPDSSPECSNINKSPRMKRQLSLEKTEVSPVKRRLATLKFL